MTQTWARTQVSRLALVIALLALVVIIASGFERQLGIDAGCPSWGACSGWQYLSGPSGSVGTMHIGAAAQLGVTVLGLLAFSRVRLRDDQRVTRAAAMALLLMIVQLGAMFVPASGNAAVWAATAHLGATALLLAVAVHLALAPVTHRLHSWIQADDAVIDSVRRVTLAAIGLLFLVLVSGAFVASSDPGFTCSDWPLCGLDDAGTLNGATAVQLSHQAFVGLAGIALVALGVIAIRHRQHMQASLIVSGLLVVFAIEVGIGALSATSANSPEVSGAHYGVAGLTWALLVALLVATPTTRSVGFAAIGRGAVSPSILRDYLRVTKPGIMLLLLTTTLGAMLIAGSAWPSIPLVLATLLGGALASGGASALNCYLDRDIDVIMARTRKRPIPTGGLTANQVRNFGLVLGVLAVIELTLLVNPVAALLALAGNLFYVVIYTRFLKRSTPQNIVIGGAAGAFPPLVGWAAVTGSVSLSSILLFAIIYYWTPPHFWSLALLKARDYGRAGIPMLPVTHGDHQTRRFILLYSLQLVAVTILLPATGTVGMIYLVGAIVLGSIFVSYAMRMYREGTTRLAWRLFKFSNYYLALLLLAMVVDRAIAR